MAQWLAPAPQPYSSGPPQDGPFDKTYHMGNGSLRLTIDTISLDHYDRVKITVTDSVAEKGGARGYAKFNLSVIKPYNKKTAWYSFSNFGGNLLSKGTQSLQVLPAVYETHLYGGRDKLRGCFSLDKGRDYYSANDIYGKAELLFGYDRGEVYAVSVKIMSDRNSLFTTIDGPAIATPNQLHLVKSVGSQIISNEEDHEQEDGKGVSKRERARATGHGTRAK